MRNTREVKKMNEIYLIYILLRMPMTWIILAFAGLMIMFPEGSNMDLLMSFVATIVTIAVSKDV